jgi:cytidylate kinase
MNIAIITAFTPDFLDQFKLFICSLRQVSKVPVISVILNDDHKISVAEKYDCIEERLDEHTINEYKESGGDRWAQWFKPHIIKKMVDKYGLDMTLWLDSDIVILQDVSPILLNVKNCFTVMADYFAPATTINNPELYQIAPSNNDSPERALNSGVVGMAFPRDQHILDEWINRCNMAIYNQRIRNNISLYDQGSLIWAMKELNLLDKVIYKPEWNFAPLRHAYEPIENRRWPFGPTSMGGDLFAEIRYDNPSAIIAHFAGYPKITDLLIHNHRRSVSHTTHHNNIHKISHKRIFVVGLERAGTHTLAEIVRKSAKHGSWVRHESNTKDDYDNTILSNAAFNKYRNIDYQFDEHIDKRISFYDRKDVSIVCDCNHRLGFFIQQIKNRIHDAKFVLLLRSPLDIIRSRIANFSIWPELINRYPVEYQLELFCIHRYFVIAKGSHNQNRYRIFPQEISDIRSWDIDIIQAHAWEINTTINIIMNQLKNIPESDYAIVWVDDLPSQIYKLKKIIDDRYLDFNIMRKMSVNKYGSSKTLSPETQKWLEYAIDENASNILKQFGQIISEHDIYIDNL